MAPPALPLHEFTGHGGRIDVAAARYPDAPRPWIDLSTGINPFAWDQAGAVDLRALPSVAGLRALEAAAGAMFGAGATSVAALPGSEIGLRLLATLGLPGPHAHVAPGYSTDGEALPGSVAIPIGRFDAMAGGTVVVANPNNPDGRVTAPERLLAFPRDRGGWLVVDEAFADSVPEASVVPRLRADDRVLVFRSFGKVFGLAGVRLGFVVGPEAMVAQVRARLGSWPVSSTAIAIGNAAYRDAAWMTATRTRLVAAAGALDDMLARHGFIATGGCPLFRLVETDDAAALFDRLARAGLLTRPFDDAPRRLRIGLPGSDEARERLGRALGAG